MLSKVTKKFYQGFSAILILIALCKICFAQSCKLNKYLAPIIAAYEVDDIVEAIQSGSSSWRDIQSEFRKIFIHRFRITTKKFFIRY